MLYRSINISDSNVMELSQFKEMDYYAVEHFALPIELMMENAGYQLAKLVVHASKGFEDKILIGVGNGNNGGGGLVAARRLAAWGYEVYLDLMSTIDRELPKTQLDRAIKFGAKVAELEQPDIWVDAYLGFSQRLPLREKLATRIQLANDCTCHRISLDIPTGFLGDPNVPFFKAHQVLSLAAAKKILFNLPDHTELFMADLGIPKKVYQKFDVEMPPFDQDGILQIHRA